MFLQEYSLKLKNIEISTFQPTFETSKQIYTFTNNLDKIAMSANS